MISDLMHEQMVFVSYASYPLPIVDFVFVVAVESAVVYFDADVVVFVDIGSDHFVFVGVGVAAVVAVDFVVVAVAVAVGAAFVGCDFAVVGVFVDFEVVDVVVDVGFVGCDFWHCCC